MKPKSTGRSAGATEGLTSVPTETVGTGRELQTPGFGVFDGDEEESVGRDGWAGAGAVAEIEEQRDLVRREAATADVKQSADDFADHITEKGAAADGVDEEVGVGGEGNGGKSRSLATLGMTIHWWR